MAFLKDPKSDKLLVYLSQIVFYQENLVFYAKYFFTFTCKRYLLIKACKKSGYNISFVHRHQNFQILKSARFLT